ncbi:MAG: single-stranded DNA-binding protein [bacterium]
MSISKAVLSGRVARNPEKRFTTNNIPITFFNIDIGENNDEMLLRVIAKGKLAEKAVDAFKKDDIVVIDGRLQYYTVKAQDGTDKKALEIDATNIEVMGKSSAPSTADSDFSFETGFDGLDEVSSVDLIGDDEIPF